MPGRSEVEDGREGDEEEEEGQEKKKNEWMNEIQAAVTRETDAGSGRVTRKPFFLAQSTTARENPETASA